MSPLMFVPAKPIHLRRLANRLEPIDVIECRAYGRTPLQAMRLGLRYGHVTYTALEGDEPVAVFGLVPISLATSLARPWLLVTPRGREHRVHLVRVGASVVSEWSLGWSMENYVHVENARAIHWLRRIGFTVDEAVCFPGTEPMHRFWKDQARV